MLGLLLLASQALLPSFTVPGAAVGGIASCGAAMGSPSAAASGIASSGAASSGAAMGRRALLQNVGFAAAALAASGTVAVPPAFAVVKAAVIDLKAELMLILRVQEACSQELRLIKTGKYRELQRLDIKRAIGMMLDNYDLAGRFNKAASAASKEQVATATVYGQTAVEGLIQILEYFPSSLKADDLTREQSGFVVAALGSTSKSIDSFLSLMPPEVVATAKKAVAEENRLNEKEFPEDMLLLNPPVVGELKMD